MKIPRARYDLPDKIPDKQPSIAILKQEIEDFSNHLQHSFINGESVDKLLIKRSDFIDKLLKRLWHYYQLSPVTLLNHAHICLIAVGGYGRQELHPFSDIDLLILTSHKINLLQSAKLSQFITLLWDLNLQIGHSVRDLDICITLALSNLTVATNLLEARWLCGSIYLFNKLQAKIQTKTFWPAQKFFLAKIQEQQKRHQYYHSTSYLLEPDIKSGLGGLRDIHILQWVAKRYFGVSSLDDMYQCGFLQANEYQALKEGLLFLWRIRFALHCIINRADNRLLFERQINVARLLGYQGNNNQVVKQMMKGFYNTTSRINKLSNILLQWIKFQSITPVTTSLSLDNHFQLQDNLLDCKQPLLLQSQPELILQLFAKLADNAQIGGIHPKTLRFLWSVVTQLPSPLSDYFGARELFIQILRQNNCVHRVLLPMHKLGLLWQYMPDWSNIVGQTQFDLFHSYTVDEHTIRVLLNLEAFQSQPQQHPLYHCIHPQLPAKELLLIAGIFHDIGKGRNGDHSLLGAEDAFTFMQLHNFNQEDTQLVQWLVKQHLLMSITAQRRDIQDPEVIKLFAEEVKTEQRLNYLYCLTVADICATNDNLWNNWKQSLLNELYGATQYYLTQQDQQSKLKLREQISLNQQKVLTLLSHNNISFDPARLKKLWRRFRVDYFLRHSPTQLASHAVTLINNIDNRPIVLSHRHTTRAGTEILIYCPDRPYLFASIVAELDRRKLNIHEAQIFTTRDGFAIDTFIVLEPNGTLLTAERQTSICQALSCLLVKEQLILTKTNKSRSKLRYFSYPTQINFLPIQRYRSTYLEISTLDRPGLLARISKVFADLDLSLHSARITTIGEKVEDLFILTENDRNPLSIPTQRKLKQKLIQVLNPNEEHLKEY